MTIINLRDFYYWYTQDEYMEVSDDVAEALRASVRYEAAYTERARYNKAYYRGMRAHRVVKGLNISKDVRQSLCP